MHFWVAGICRDAAAGLRGVPEDDTLLCLFAAGRFDRVVFLCGCVSLADVGRVQGSRNEIRAAAAVVAGTGVVALEMVVLLLLFDNLHALLWHATAVVDHGQ